MKVFFGELRGQVRRNVACGYFSLTPALSRWERENGSAGWSQRLNAEAAFTLLEVMIAVALFFMGVFAILGLMSQNLAAAARLQRVEIDIASVAAEVTITNLVQEGVESGDFGDLYPGASWTRNVTEVSTNGLFQVDIVVMRPPANRFAKAPPPETLSLLLYRPNSGLGRRGGIMSQPGSGLIYRGRGQ